MRLVGSFSALGLEACPWSAAEIAMRTTKSGRRVRGAYRPKKSNIAAGSVNLEDWQRFVADAAENGFRPDEIPDGPVMIAMQFIARAPEGKSYGELWDVPIKLTRRKDRKSGDTKEVWTKAAPRGKSEPDLINMLKGTEDAIQDVLFRNDVQTRAVFAVTVFGPVPGVAVEVWAFEKCAVLRRFFPPVRTVMPWDNSADL